MKHLAHSNECLNPSSTLCRLKASADFHLKKPLNLKLLSRNWALSAIVGFSLLLSGSGCAVMRCRAFRWSNTVICKAKSWWKQVRVVDGWGMASIKGQDFGWWSVSLPRDPAWTVLLGQVETPRMWLWGNIGRTWLSRCVTRSQWQDERQASNEPAVKTLIYHLCTSCPPPRGMGQRQPSSLLICIYECVLCVTTKWAERWPWNLVDPSCLLAGVSKVPPTKPANMSSVQIKIRFRVQGVDTAYWRRFSACSHSFCPLSVWRWSPNWSDITDWSSCI